MVVVSPARLNVTTAILGVGADVVDIARFRRLDEKQVVLRELFTRAEIQRAPAGDGEDAYYAMLFAAKEALLKSLGIGLQRGSHWHDMEVTETGQMHLTGSLERLSHHRSVGTIHISMSSVDDNAFAVVLLETTNRQESS